MEYIIHYDISSLVLFAVTAIVFAVRKRIPCKKNKMFGALLCVSALSAVFDILSVITDKSNGQVIRTLLNIGYYAAHNLTPFVSLLYILYLTESAASMNKKYKAAVYIPIMADLLLILTSPLTKLIIYIDSEGHYNKGSFQPFCYVVAVYYVILMIVVVMNNRRKLSTQVIVSIFSFIGISLLCVIIQILYPELLIECFGSSVCLSLMMLTLQNQDDILDSSTKMLNRSAFINNCTIKFRSSTPFSILFIRIPDVTMLMKTFGGRFASSVLEGFSNYLYSFVSLGDGYYLEDECFALTFPKSSENLEKVYRKIHIKLESNWNIGTVDTLITACFMQLNCPDDVDNIESLMDMVEQFKQMNCSDDRLLHASDINLYDRKRRKDVEQAIDRAIKKENFRVYYQPIYSETKKKIISCEALVRLIDDKLGFIPPDEFIPISEENGKILKIGKFVFEEVCKFIEKGIASALGIEYVQVNLSVVQCMQSDLVEQFENIMEQYNIDPSKICLEVTETSAVYTPQIMEKNIKALSDIGIRFALDDYGSGYANMTYLLNLPFRFIKLEKEIVWAGFKSSKAHIAIESTVAMVKKLNMQIVAEGVETAEQLNSLLGMGCDFIQGYYFSKPVPENEFNNILKKYNAS